MKKQKRRFRLINAIIAALTIAIGFITIMGLMAEDRSLPISVMADGLLQITAVVIALAVVVGILNLLVVHLMRVVRSEGGWYYSIVTLLSAIFVGIVYAGDKFDIWTGELEDQKLSPVVFKTLQITIEAALAGIIVFFLVYAAYRMLNRRFTWATMFFVIAVLVALVGWLPLGDITGFTDARDWLMEFPVLAGSRGILIGIGLGTVVVGIRALTGTDQAYREP